MGIDINGNGSLGMDDIKSLLIGGIIGMLGLLAFGMAGLIPTVDYISGFITAVIVVLATGLAKGFGIGK